MMNSDVVVIGAGVAGMETAGRLAEAGIKVTLLEKDEKTGGHLTGWYHLFPDRRPGSEVIKYLDDLKINDNLNLLKGVTLEDARREKDGFELRTSKGDIFHSRAVVVATGFDLFRSER
ncbi:MAG TPA: FAD-dependent oxidoreductase, partial [Bacteroidales bacterium]|nr:FAD-dependent oxidoreductase [Bacteroidales bacterium]